MALPLQDTQFKLEASGMKVASLHGEMSKMERQQVLAKFRAGGYRAMVRPAPAGSRGALLQARTETASVLCPADVPAWQHSACGLA